MANEGQGTRNTSSNSHTFSFDSPRLNDGCFSNRRGFDSNGFMFSSMGKTSLNSENLGLGRSTSRTSDGEFKYGGFSSTNSFSVGNTSFAKNTHTGRSKPRLTKLSKNPSTFKGKFPAENRGESSGLNPLKQTVGAEKFGVLSQPEETQSSISSGSYAFHNNDHHKAKSFGKANGTVESGSSEFVFKQDVESPYVESAPKPMFVPSVSAARLQEVSKQNPAMAGVVSEELEASLKSGMAEETNGNNVQSVLSSKFMPVQNDQSRSSIHDFLKENEELRTRIRNWRPYSDDKGMERPAREFLFKGIAKEGSYAKETNGGGANVPVNAEGSTGNPKIPSFSFANNAFAPASTGNPTNAASSGTSIPLHLGEGAATNYCMSSEFLQEMKLRDHIKDWNPFGDGSKQRDSQGFKNDEHQNSRNSTRRGDHFEKFSSIEVPFAPEIRGGQVPDMNGKDVDPSCSKKVLEDKKVPFQQSFLFTSTSQPKSMTKRRSKHKFHAGVHSNNSSQKAEGTCDPLLSSPTKCSDSNIAEENLGEKAKKFFNKADVSAIPESLPQSCETDSKGSVSSDNAFDIKTDNLNSSKFLFNEGKFGNSSKSTFPCGSFKETCNAAPSDRYSCPGDTEKPHGEGTVFENEQANGDDSWPYMQSLSSSLDQVFEFHASNIPKQSSVSRKKKGKAHVPSFIRRKNVKPSTITKSKTRMTSPYPANWSEEGSPMDFSPYSETVINNESTFDSKGMSDGGQSSKTAFPFDDQETFYTTETPEMEAKVEELRAAASKLHIGTNNTGTFENNTEEQRPGGEKCQASSNVMHTEAAIHDDYSQNEDKYEEVSLPNSESEWFKSRMEQVKIKDNNTTETATFEKNNTNQQFTFAASFSKTASSSNRHRFRRRQRSNNVESLHVSDTPTKLESTASSFVFHVEVRQQDTERVDSKKFGKEGSYEVAERVSNVGSSSDASQETPENVDTASAMKLMCEETKKACEEWRCLGNQAYAIGDFPRAEDYYSKGANVVFPIETPQQCIRASMLCYSNRAATRMALGRWREALADCKRAMAIDPKFLRVQIRAASCHLGLGENEEAIIIFKECLRSAKEIDTLDLKIAPEASEGLKKAEQGLEYCEHAAKLMNTKSAADMINALCMLTEALSLSPYSEQLLQMKVSSLLFLRRYDEAIQVCEQSFDFAEKNCATENLHNNQKIDDSNEGLAKAFSQLWRWHMCAKSHFYMGRLEEAHSLLAKYENVNLSLQRLGMKSTESLGVFMDKVHNLLQHKVAGNKAFQAGRHAEAVEHYTAALACGGDSRPFTAVCFCNRAAASQALGLIADAIADCSRAIALDPNYPKALSRRATLHEMVHDHAQSAADLQRLVYLLEKQKEEKLSGRLACSNTITRDLRQANDRLAKAQKEVKAMKPVNHYLILGVKASSSAAEIKKAYRKAALKYHPDKAGQSLLRGDEGDDGSWKEVEHQVCRDAERLFKMIGEAYAVLSDPEKRLCYDEEESNSFYHEKVNRKYGNQWEQWDNKYADPYYQRRKSPESARRFYRRRGSKFTDDWD